jgi:hypothetical protein
MSLLSRSRRFDKVSDFPKLEGLSFGVDLRHLIGYQPQTSFRQMNYIDIDEIPSSGGLRFLNEGEEYSLPTM